MSWVCEVGDSYAVREVAIEVAVDLNEHMYNSGALPIPFHWRCLSRVGMMLCNDK